MSPIISPVMPPIASAGIAAMSPAVILAIPPGATSPMVPAVIVPGSIGPVVPIIIFTSPFFKIF